MKIKLYNILLAGFLLTSCEKEIPADVPADFAISTEAITYKAGEEIIFNVKGGDAQRIAFYSGETQKDYAFKGGRVIDVKGAGATMAFQTSVQVGAQANQLSVWASTDFNGDYTFENVKAANWTDITGRFVLGTTTAFRASGTKDITDLMVAGKPIYIAFKYITRPQATNGLARQWFIQSFVVNSKKKLDGNALTLTDQLGAAFRIVDENEAHAPARPTVTDTRITLYGNEYLYSILAKFDPTNPIYDPLNPIYDPQSPLYRPTAIRPVFVPFDPASPYNDPLSEHWAISKPIYEDKVDLGPDWSTSIKTPTDPELVEYRYTYSAPGTYKAVFIASNNSIDNAESVTKEITLTITP